jgi:transcriptional regulator GlxA family with amidase domain
VIIAEHESEALHRSTAEELNIEWLHYEVAARLTPRVTESEIDGIGSLLATIGRLITEQAHRNILLRRRLDGHKDDHGGRIRHRRRIVDRAIQWMQEHVEDGICVQSVADAVGVSHQQLSRLFKSVTGCSAVDVLSDLKVQHAKRLFDHERMSVTDVAAALGYNPQYFSRLFHRRVGVTPSRYLSGETG